MDLGEKVVVITGEDGLIEYVNSAFTASSGYTAREVLGKSPRILKSGLMPEEVYRRMWATLQTGDSWRGEFLNRKKNGELYWEQVIMVRLQEPGETQPRYMAVKENITEKKLLRGRLEMLQGVMRVLSGEIDIKLAAPRLARIITDALAAGWVEFWILDSNSSDLVCAGSYRAGLFSSQQNPVSEAGTRLARGRDPRFLAMEALSHVRLHAGDARQQMAFPIRTEKGGAGVLIVGDLLNSQSVIPAIELVCAQLGHFIQRTRMEQELLRARDVAEASNRAKSAFLSNMSHELRNPLNSILGFTQLLKESEDLEAVSQQKVESIERAGLELLSLINAILDISKVVSTPSAQYPKVLGGTQGGSKPETVQRLIDAEEKTGSASAQTALGREDRSTNTVAPQSKDHELAALLTQIRTAADTADIERINRLNDAVAKINPALAMHISQDAELFDYVAIREKLEQI